MTTPDLYAVGTTTCPDCGRTVRVYRRSFTVQGRTAYVAALHLAGDDYCPRQGKRVAPEEITFYAGGAQ